MQEQIRKTILGMEGAFSISDVLQKLELSDHAHRMDILSVISQLGEVGIVSCCHVETDSKTHQYIVNPSKQGE